MQNENMCRQIFAFCLLIIVIISVNAQRKPGDCPSTNDVGVCIMTCHRDAHCGENFKCCRTACGGSVCMEPVIARPPQPVGEKPGNCPHRPTGPWVCSSTCSFDGDCRGSHKCCKNRCGAMACTKPQ